MKPECCFDDVVTWLEFAPWLVFFDHVVSNKSLPTLARKHTDGDGVCRLTLTSQPEPISVRFWTARSSTKDFRDSKWESKTLAAKSNGEFIGDAAKLSGGHIALFEDAQFTTPSGTVFTLSTQIRRE